MICASSPLSFIVNILAMYTIQIDLRFFFFSFLFMCSFALNFIDIIASEIPNYKCRIPTNRVFVSVYLQYHIAYFYMHKLWARKKSAYNTVFSQHTCSSFCVKIHICIVPPPYIQLNWNDEDILFSRSALIRSSFSFSLICSLVHCVYSCNKYNCLFGLYSFIDLTFD